MQLFAFLSMEEVTPLLVFGAITAGTFWVLSETSSRKSQAEECLELSEGKQRERNPVRASPRQSIMPHIGVTVVMFMLVVAWFNRDRPEATSKATPESQQLSTPSPSTSDASLDPGTAAEHVKRLATRTGETEEKIRAQARSASGLLREKGIHQSTESILEGMDDVYPQSKNNRITLSYAECLAMYCTVREKESHYDTLAGMKGIMRRLGVE